MQGWDTLHQRARTIWATEGRQVAKAWLRETLIDEGVTKRLAEVVGEDVLAGERDSFDLIVGKASQRDRGLRVLSKSTDEREIWIYGPASVAIRDREGDLITGPALAKALPQLIRAARLSFQHADILVGSIEPEATIGGRVYKTEVRPVTKEDLAQFELLRKAEVEVGTDALFLVGKIWGDREYCLELQDEILKGEIAAFSISGQALKDGEKVVCDGFSCKMVNQIDALSLSACTICATGMNQGSGFVVIQKAEFSMAESKPITPNKPIVLKLAKADASLDDALKGAEEQLKDAKESRADKTVIVGCYTLTSYPDGHVQVTENGRVIELTSDQEKNARAVLSATKTDFEYVSNVKKGCSCGGKCGGCGDGHRHIKKAVPSLNDYKGEHLPVDYAAKPTHARMAVNAHDEGAATKEIKADSNYPAGSDRMAGRAIPVEEGDRESGFFTRAVAILQAAEDDRIAKEMLATVAKNWVPYVGPTGARGAKNTISGDIRYGEEAQRLLASPAIRGSLAGSSAAEHGQGRDSLGGQRGPYSVGEGRARAQERGPPQPALGAGARSEALAIESQFPPDVAGVSRMQGHGVERARELQNAYRHGEGLENPTAEETFQALQHRTDASGPGSFRQQELEPGELTDWYFPGEGMGDKDRRAGHQMEGDYTDPRFHKALLNLIDKTILKGPWIWDPTSDGRPRASRSGFGGHKQYVYDDEAVRLTGISRVDAGIAGPNATTDRERGATVGQMVGGGAHPNTAESDYNLKPFGALSQEARDAGYRALDREAAQAVGEDVPEPAYGVRATEESGESSPTHWLHEDDYVADDKGCVTCRQRAKKPAFSPEDLNKMGPEMAQQVLGLIGDTLHMVAGKVEEAAENEPEVLEDKEEKSMPESVTSQTRRHQLVSAHQEGKLPAGAYKEDDEKMMEGGEEVISEDEKIEKSAHSVRFKKITKAVEGDSLTKHRIAFTVAGREHVSGCHECFVLSKKYDDPIAYFQVTRKALLTGRHAIGALTSSDHRHFKNEWPTMKDACERVFAAEV